MPPPETFDASPLFGGLFSAVAGQPVSLSTALKQIKAKSAAAKADTPAKAAPDALTATAPVEAAPAAKDAA